MRVMRRFTLTFALAVAFLSAPIVNAAERVVSYLASGQESYLAKSQKFEAELAYSADFQTGFGTSISSDLTRDGHGYRQFSAMESAQHPDPA